MKQYKIKELKNLLGYQNAKTTKGEDLGYLTGIMYLAPANIVSGLNLCPFASKGCKQACLFSAGRGKFSNVYAARIKKTELYRDNLELFMQSLVHDINKAVKRAKNKGLKLCIRLNGTSDIRFETLKDSKGNTIFDLFPNTQFYDYTKDFKRFDSFSVKLPDNYHVTFSVNESNERYALKLLSQGINAAIVFRGDLPETYRGFKVIDGDKHDLRFLDNTSGVIVGLKAKGEAKKDSSGFVKESEINFISEAA